MLKEVYFLFRYGKYTIRYYDDGNINIQTSSTFKFDESLFFMEDCVRIKKGFYQVLGQCSTEIFCIHPEN